MKRVEPFAEENEAGVGHDDDQADQIPHVEEHSILTLGKWQLRCAPWVRIRSLTVLDVTPQFL